MSTSTIFRNSSRQESRIASPGRTRTIAYWTTIVILEFTLLSGGIADLVHVKATVDGMLHLGYPLYFVTLLGFWKVMGGIALLLPRFPRVQEWAYAGIFFDFSGAMVSHVASGDSAGHIITTLVFALITVASWALRPVR